MDPAVSRRRRGLEDSRAETTSSVASCSSSNALDEKRSCSVPTKWRESAVSRSSSSALEEAKHRDSPRRATQAVDLAVAASSLSSKDAKSCRTGEGPMLTLLPTRYGTIIHRGRVAAPSHKLCFLECSDGLGRPAVGERQFITVRDLGQSSMPRMLIPSERSIDGTAACAEGLARASLLVPC
ncbi:hypothetical protein PMIN06_005893 [Paraphaeosphaeria minitans]